MASHGMIIICELVIYVHMQAHITYIFFIRCMHHGVHIAKDWNQFGVMLLNIYIQRQYAWDEWIVPDSPV